MDFFNQMEPLLRMFWLVAIPVSLIFIIQSVMTFVGIDAHDGEVPDFDGDLDASGGDMPFQLFSFRNLVNFLIGFSWGGISFYNTIHNPVVLVMVAVLIGAAFIALFFVIIRQLMKLAENNSFQMQETAGKIGQVYIRIPPHQTGRGKVQVSVRGATHELDAITDGEELASGSSVKVLSVLDGNLLLVEKM